MLFLERTTNETARSLKAKTRLRPIIVRALLVIAGSLLTGNITSARQPNIVLILADDLGWHQTGCYGSTFYETPHIDRLAAKGMKFTDAYAACPVCSPTRVSIMTGKYPARLNTTDFFGGAGKRKPTTRTLVEPTWTMKLPLSETTIAEALKSVGYATGHFGKWHLNEDKKYAPGRAGDPGSQGFDDVLTTHKPGAGPSSQYEHDAHHVREITERAIEFIDSHRDEAFFCYVPHNSIHRPIFEREELINKYRRKPASDLPQHNPGVAAMVETLDASVGRILQCLQANSLANSTMLIFVSDNGCMFGPDVLKPLRGGKADLFEGGIRVPMVVRWPEHTAPGSTCSIPVSTVDFFPTLMDAAGSPATDLKIDGESLVTLLKQTGSLQRDAIYWHYPHYHKLAMAPGGAIREGRYKLIEWFENSVGGVNKTRQIELFDLEADISEQHNIAAQHPERAQRLWTKLQNWRRSVAAQVMERQAGDPTTTLQRQ